ncbi:hypothetical protein DPEC_G00279740 [Dallia pectoralis]|uniref:Uncharacterized protein n=1 Tax=Dallia pectoralis TaxID=75939 RepID=A0ACC2FMT7_DALPE|nr:hypothetical protein DPEC_G00279740 [Dallia pectoralis]
MLLGSPVVISPVPRQRGTDARQNPGGLGLKEVERPRTSDHLKRLGIVSRREKTTFCLGCRKRLNELLAENEERSDLRTERGEIVATPTGNTGYLDGAVVNRHVGGQPQLAAFLRSISYLSVSQA